MSFDSTPCIDIDRLTVRFPGRDRRALHDVSAHIDPGQIVAVAGPSGCGKTTLLRTMAGFVPDMIRADVHGEIRVDGTPIQTMATWQRPPAIGLVQQDPDAQVCTLRVRSEVAFGPENLCLPRKQIDSLVNDALEAMGIAHLADRDAPTLSGGEKQRLAVAAILAMQPSVILLDEPTAHLDPAGAKDLFDLLGKLHQQRGCTLVIVEHRLTPLTSLHPDLWIMDAGQIVQRHETRIHKDAFVIMQRAGVHRSGEASPRTALGELMIEHLSFGYDKLLLDDLCLSVAPGTVLGIIGPNGGGKTTLLRLLAGLEQPAEGRVTRPEDSLLGMVFQHPHQQIFERTVRRDLEIEGVLSAEQLALTLQSARLVGMADVPPHSLSLGEQRRLTILSAFRTHPGLLLLDEPFIGQDRENAAWIVEQIHDARERGTVVCLVTHDIPMADSLCDRLLYLGDDAAIFGTPSEVFDALRGEGRTAFTPEFWGAET